MTHFNSPYRVWLGVLLGFLGVITASMATTGSHIATVYVWPLSTSTPLPYRSFSYNARIASISAIRVLSSMPPVATDDIVRIGTYDRAGQWIGSAFTGKMTNNTKITIRIDSQGFVSHLEYSIADSQDSSNLHISKPTPAVLPVLNRPIVLSVDGKLLTQEPERTFLQKYWWVLLGGFILVISGGGAGGE